MMAAGSWNEVECSCIHHYIYKDMSIVFYVLIGVVVGLMVNSILSNKNTDKKSIEEKQE